MHQAFPQGASDNANDQERGEQHRSVEAGTPFPRPVHIA
jgi:hypothetical protein